MAWRWTLLAVVAATACAACEFEREGEVPRASRSESAGVEIVRNSVEELPQGELITPPTRVFGSETEGPELFGRVSSARLHRNGSVWVVEQQAHEIRVFDAGSGAHLFTVGGVGEGPGEFRRLRMLGFDREGAAYVYDEGTLRLTVFSEDGELLRTEMMPASSPLPPRPLHVTASGTLLGQLPSTLDRAPADGTTVRDTVRIWTIPLQEKEPELVAEAPGALRYFGDGIPLIVPYTGQLPPPYGGGALHGFQDGRVYVTDASGDASFSVFGPAGLERRVEVDREPKRIEDFSATRFVEHMRRVRWPESRVRSYEEHLADMPIPQKGVAWEGIVFADEGGVWLKRASEWDVENLERTSEVDVWDVFDREGALVGVVRVPSNVWPQQLTGRCVLAIVWDDVGRSSVAIYDIRWVE